MARLSTHQLNAAPTGEKPDYSSIDLTALKRFADYVEESKRSSVPLSFRAFMKGKGNHPAMLSSVESIESTTQQLMLMRALLDEQGQKTGDYTDRFQVAEGTDTRREPGMVTRHGHLWAEAGVYVDRLFKLMMDMSDDLDELHRLLRAQQAGLVPLEDKVRRDASGRPNRRPSAGKQTGKAQD